MVGAFEQCCAQRKIQIAELVFIEPSRHCLGVGAAVCLTGARLTQRNGPPDVKRLSDTNPSVPRGGRGDGRPRPLAGRDDCFRVVVHRRRLRAWKSDCSMRPTPELAPPDS